MRYAGMIWRNAVAELRYRYVGSWLGLFWHVLNPLAQIAIFTIVFGTFMQQDDSLFPPGGFALYLCSGLLPWIAFAETVQRGTGCFLGNATYLKKLPVPELVYAIQGSLASTLGMGVTLLVLMLVTPLLGGVAHPSWLAVPAVLLLLQVFGTGLGLLLGTVNVFFRDTAQLIAIALQAWMWLTPIVYQVRQPGQEGLRDVLRFNPTFWFIEPMHAVYLDGRLPGPSEWLLMLLGAGGTLVLGMLVFGKLRWQIRDVV